MKSFAKIVTAIFIAACTVMTPLTVSAEVDKDAMAQMAKIFADVESYIATLPTAKGNYKSRQRPILIQGAMNPEIDKLIHALQKPVVYKYLNFVYIVGKFNDYPVVISRTEQGMTNTAAATAMAVEHFNPVAVINQGTSGGYLSTLHHNDIVVGERSINASSFIEDYQPKGNFDVTRQHLRGTFAYDNGNFQLHEYFSADAKLLQIAKDVAAAHNEFNITVGTIASADSWHNAIDYINFARETYGSLCEEMESNAAAQICYSANIPFIGFRVISNNITNGEDFLFTAAYTVQDFTLLTVEKYISDVLRKN